jgi:hypothetical protein
MNRGERKETRRRHYPELQLKMEVRLRACRDEFWLGYVNLYQNPLRLFAPLAVKKMNRRER